MSKFQELKDKKIKTVGELIDNLLKFSRDTLLVGNGPDYAGYDCRFTDYVSIKLDEGRILIGNLEEEAYDLLQSREITRQEFNSEFQ